MSSVLLVTYSLPDEYARWVFSVDPIPGIQSNTFSHSLVQAFEHTGMEVEVLASAPIQDHPTCSIAYLPRADLHFARAKGVVFPTSNKPFRKRFQRMLYVMRETLRKKPDYAVVHGLYFPYLLAGCFASIVGSRTILVLTDPSGIALAGDSTTRSLLKKLDARISRFFSRRFTFGLALSPSLASNYIPGKECLIVPGIFPDLPTFQTPLDVDRQTQSVSRTLRVGYFGGIIAGYGVLEFVSAVARSALDVEVDVYGVGSEKNAVAEISTRDKRIKLKGIVERTAALKQMKTYDVLINPRHSSSVLEKNAFPSKIFDYALARRAVMTTPLVGLPEHIRKHLFEYDSRKESDVLRVLTEIKNMVPRQLDAKGADFSRLMMIEYNAASLGNKIAKLIARAEG